MARRHSEFVLTVAQRIAERYASLPQVETVALGGSQASARADLDSDIDLYVYTSAEIPITSRTAIATTHSEFAEVDNRFWEPGDEWVDLDSYIHVDVMFRSTTWIQEQLDRLLVRHQAQVGYSTCLWHNVLASQVLADPGGWFARLQEWARQPYPDELRKAIIAKNYPLLRGSLSSFLSQIERSAARFDWVSMNHRTTALLASYFDILFAVNRLPHPGEKRLVQIAERSCILAPDNLGAQVEALVRSLGEGDQPLMDCAEALIQELELLLAREGLLP